MSLCDYPEKLNCLSALLKSLSNEKRLKIVCSLLESEKNVGELEAIVGISQSALSQHLARLRRDDIVQTRRDAQTIFYSIKCASTTGLLQYLLAIEAKNLQA